MRRPRGLLGAANPFAVLPGVEPPEELRPYTDAACVAISAARGSLADKDVVVCQGANGPLAAIAPRDKATEQYRRLAPHEPKLFEPVPADQVRISVFLPGGSAYVVLTSVERRTIVQGGRA